jgi:hypothetical protein
MINDPKTYWLSIKSQGNNARHYNEFEAIKSAGGSLLRLV